MSNQPSATSWSPEEGTVPQPPAPDVTSYRDPNYVYEPREPFSDSGPLEEIDVIREGRLAELIVGRRAGYRMPEDPDEKRAYALETLDAIARFRETGELTSPALVSMANTWGPKHFQRNVDLLEGQMSESLQDPNTTGPIDNTVDIVEWLGIEVEGDFAKASVIAHERVLRSPTPMMPIPANWVDIEERQYDYDLIKVDGTWKIQEWNAFRTDGATGP